MLSAPQSKWRSLSPVGLLETPWTVVCQAPLSMGLPRQEFWSGWHFLLQGIFPTKGLKPGLLHCRQILHRLSHQRSPSVDLSLSHNLKHRVYQPVCWLKQMSNQGSQGQNPFLESPSGSFLAPALIRIRPHNSWPLGFSSSSSPSLLLGRLKKSNKPKWCNPSSEL